MPKRAASLPRSWKRHDRTAHPSSARAARLPP
jgi:hypothetical protein